MAGDPTVTIYFDSVYDDPLVFVLDDPVQGELDSAFVLGGDLPVDITSYVRSYQIQRGRSRELDDIVVGSCQLVLNNHTRAFDPLYAAGPFFGSILPTKRVTIAVEGVTIFDGRIDDWSFDWTVDGQAIAICDLVDALGHLGRIDFDEWTTTAGQTAGPRLTAALDRSEVAFGASRDLDTGVSTLQADLVTWGSNVLNYLQLVSRSDLGRLFASRENVLTFKDRHATLNPTPTITFTDDRAGYVRLNGTAGTYVSCPDIAALAGAGTLRVELDVALDDWTPADLPGLMGQTNGVADASWRFFMNTGGTTFMDATIDGAYVSFAQFATSAAFGFVDGSRHSIAFDCDLDDGASNSNCQFETAFGFQSWSDFESLKTSTTEFASGLRNSSQPVTLGWVNGVDEAIGNFYRANIYANGVLVASPDFRGMTAGQTSVTDTQGNVWTLQGAAAVVPLSGIPYSLVGTRYGSDFLFNRVGVDREGGTLQTAGNSTSQAAYGVHTLSLTGLLLDSDTQSDAMADYLLGIYKEPEFHFAAIQVIVSALSVADRALVLALEIADTVTVKFTPTDVGAQISEIAAIEGVSHQHSVDGLHFVTFALGAVDSRAVFVLNDAVFGVLNGSSVLAL